ncbi:MAG: non-canonical purine NTP pyrophosphatase [Acidobacteriaceae bacterium]
MSRLYVATSNPGKLRDFAVAAEESGVAIEPLSRLREIPPPPENEPTFAGNARAKAAYYSRFAPGELVLADDSGLEVDALHGAPGTHSARYAADAGFETAAAASPDRLSPDQRNNLYLLTKLADVPAGSRHARYRCVLVAARDGVCLYTGEGSVEGEVLTQPRGHGGFGYDPLFYLPVLQKTMAEIDLITKHSISHRGKALRNLLLSVFKEE